MTIAWILRRSCYCNHKRMFNKEQSSDVKGYLVLRDLFGGRYVPHIAIDFVHTESTSGLFTYQGHETSLFLHRLASSGIHSALVGILESLHNPWWQCIHLLRPLLFPNLCPFHSSSSTPHLPLSRIPLKSSTRRWPKALPRPWTWPSLLRWRRKPTSEIWWHSVRRHTTWGRKGHATRHWEWRSAVVHW